MSQLQVLDFRGNQVRMVLINGEPWWVAKDVCEALGIANYRDAVARLDDDEKDAVGITDAIGRTQETAIINEPGLYRIILGQTWTDRAGQVHISHKTLVTGLGMTWLQKRWDADHPPSDPPRRRRQLSVVQ